MAVTRVQGWETPVPTFAETVFAPFAQAVAQRGKFDLEQQALDKRTIASALVQMGRLGVPGTQTGAPTFGFAGQQFPITEAPMDWGNILNQMQTLTFGQPTWQNIVQLLNTMGEQELLQPGRKAAPSTAELLNQIQAMGIPLPAGTTTTEPVTLESMKPKGKKIRMKAPDGKLWDLDPSEAMEYKQKFGFTEVQ